MTVTKTRSGAKKGPSSPASSSRVPPVGALRRAVETIASFVGGLEPGRYSGEDAAVLAEIFTRAERLCGAGKTLAASRVAESNRPALQGQKSAAHWLAQLTGDSLGEAASTLDLGQALESQPQVDEAFREGRLSKSRARLVSGAVKEDPKCEGEMVRGAESDTLSQLKERCLRAKARGRSEREAERAYETIKRSRYCRTWTDAEGAFRLDARLTPDAGARLLSSLTAESNRVFESARQAGMRENPSAYAADALVALVTGEGGPDRATRQKTGSSRSDRRGELDPKALVHLRVDLCALRRGDLRSGEICEIPGVGPVPLSLARSLMGDALTKLVIADGVDVTTVCHLGRSIPASLKTALIERDQTCVVPGCDVATGLEFDHFGTAFADGGPVSMDNIARLCHWHHSLKTHKGFTLTGGPGRWRWDPPQKGTSRSDERAGSRRGTGPPGPDGHDPPLFTAEE